MWPNLLLLLSATCGLIAAGCQPGLLRQFGGQPENQPEQTQFQEGQDDGGGVSAEVDSEPNPLGIVAEKPESGPFVETEFGFMVPYAQKIEGTEIVIEMIPIPGGTFSMGCPEDAEYGYDDEKPQVEVTIQPFWMAKTETTWAQFDLYRELHDVFKEFQRANYRKVTEENKIDAITVASNLYDSSFTYNGGDAPETPAATMTPYTARQFTKWLSLGTGVFYRLPYESEWEYACRAGSTSAWHFGDDEEMLEEYGWFEDNSDDERQPVGQLKPNDFGLYDMHGNVAEWVLDQYQEDWFATLAEQENLSPATAFREPDKAYPRVARGGSWEMDADSCRSGFRLSSDDPEWKSEDPNYPKSPWWYTSEPSTGVGFRVIRPLLGPTERSAKEYFWGGAVEEIVKTAEKRIYREGRGAEGLAGPDLLKAVKDWQDK